MTRSDTEILFVTGAAGVGKSTLCWEMSSHLAEAGIAHAVIESDELDRVFPKPTEAELELLRPGTIDVSTLNLAAMWRTYAALGHKRLIMSGVVMHPEFDRRWVLAAIPGASIKFVRLLASESTLLARLAGRETGSAGAAQAERTLRQARRIATESPDTSLRFETDGETPAALAAAVLRACGWLDRPANAAKA